MSGTVTVEMERIVRASRDAVWELWTTAEGLRRWWWAHWSDVRIAVDPVVGGLLDIDAPGGGIGVSGVFREVDRPECLVFTWIWHDADGDGPEDLVDVGFTEAPGGTLVTVRHSGSWPDAGQAEEYRTGWGQVLDALAAAAHPAS